MEAEIRLCIVCQENALTPSQSKFCGKVCYRKYCTAKQIIQRKQKTKEKIEKPTLPEWICPDGHLIKLDFNPLKNFKLMATLTCSVCGKKYED